MKLPVNTKYKYSGFEWLGDVPEQWNIASMRWVSRRFSGGTPDRSDDTYWEDGHIPWINSGAVNQGLITEPSAYITDAGYSGSSAKWVPKGGLVMALAGQGKTKGMVAQLGIDTTCNQSMAAIIPDKRIAPRFLYWWLSAQYDAIRNLAGGEQRDGLNLDILGTLPVALFSTDEQTIIADYLDRQTTQIDYLIAKKRELIGKLKEKRIAIISGTVTRGLPPVIARTFGIELNAKYKPSGIDWLGDVPGQWAVPPLYIRYRVELGKMLNESRITGTYLVPYLRNVDVQWSSINYTDLPEMDIPESEYTRYTIRKNDLLVCEGGEVGRAAIVGQVSGVVGYQKALHRLRRISSDEVPRFMFYVLYWAANAGIFSAGGSSTIAHLTGEQLRRYRFPKPPKREQLAIVNYLDGEVAKIDTLTERMQNAIERLQEYRTALIATTVTGKIDVRREAA